MDGVDHATVENVCDEAADAPRELCISVCVRAGRVPRLESAVCVGGGVIGRALSWPGAADYL
jgi:hypothetical protein